MGFNDFIGDLGDKIVGKDEEYYEDDYYTVEEDVYDEDDYYEEEPKRSLFGRKSNVKEPQIPAPRSNAYSTVMLIEPKNFNDAPLVCDNLKEGITVVVNMDKVENEEAKKIFDFLSGAVYVLCAKMKRIAHNVFILAPEGVDVETQEDPNEGYTTDSRLWEYRS